jgi:photosystem II stability/assembly factor-like uncharacterized protein
VDVYFADQYNGWVGGRTADTSSIYITTDGGASWNIVLFPDGSTIDNIFAIDKNNIWAVGGNIYYSTDGFQTYSVLPNTGGSAQGFKMFSNTTGYKFTNKTVYKTEDGGASWVPISTINNNSPYFYVNKAAFVDSNTIWLAVNYLNYLYYSLDSGATWSTVTIPSKFQTDMDIRDITFIDKNNGWLSAVCPLSLTNPLGNHGEIWKTTDGGHSWNLDLEIVPGTANLEMDINLQVKDVGHGWAIDSFGKIFQYITYKKL